MAKLAVFFDGTWNTPADRTNVYKLYKLLDDRDSSKQQAHYVQGVGTEKGGLLASFKNFLGGAFGDGLSENILDGYKWLINVYQKEDEVFLFGFSRGAYSARSLAGLIRNCGILHKESLNYVDEAYDIYRDKLHPESKEPRDFRNRFSAETFIKFIGVWDTVGALGIPVEGWDLPGFRENYHFHDTNLSNKVKAAYQALAINEFRAPYAPTLWTRDPDQARPEGLPVEQRWFIGAHSNIGGGYTGDKLCNLSCRWIQKMARKHGLKFFTDWLVGEEDYRTDPRDSYKEFIEEHPEAGKVVEHQCRLPGQPLTLNETVDPSVRKRVESDQSFLKGKPGLKDATLNLPVGQD
jgi:uncharacterized protein (DUF2235 family)